MRYLITFSYDGTKFHGFQRQNTVKNVQGELEQVLSTVLDETIETVNLNENIVLREELPNDKMGIVDVLAKINGNEFCNIEMQLVDKKNIIKRLLFYWSKQYRKGIKSGEDYKELKRTIVVLIADFELESIKELEFHSIWQIIEKKKKKISIDR